MFEKLEGEKHRHMKPLYVKGFIVGEPMTKLLVDGGAAINLKSYTTHGKLGQTLEDLIKTYDARGLHPSQTRGVLNVELTISIDSKTLPTTFFVIDQEGSYISHLMRDWIHTNCCDPSIMHQ